MLKIFQNRNLKKYEYDEIKKIYFHDQTWTLVSGNFIPSSIEYEGYKSFEFIFSSDDIYNTSVPCKGTIVIDYPQYNKFLYGNYKYNTVRGYQPISINGFLRVDPMSKISRRKSKDIRDLPNTREICLRLNNTDIRALMQIEKKKINYSLFRDEITGEVYPYFIKKIEVLIPEVNE